MTPVIIESPYAGHVERNKAYLQLCLRDSIERGESPFASHQMYTDCLDDRSVEERSKGVGLVTAWAHFARLTAVYTDFGISNGMHHGIAQSKKDLRPIEYREIFQGVSEAIAFYTDQDIEQGTPWQELLARARANKLTRLSQDVVATGGVVSAVCIIVIKPDPSDPRRPLVLAIEGAKGLGLPGGRIELGETPEAAAARELLEETGLSLRAEATLKELPTRPTDNGVIVKGFWVKHRDTLGTLHPGDEGLPMWLTPSSLVQPVGRNHTVRFPNYNKWAFDLMGLFKQVTT